MELVPETLLRNVCGNCFHPDLIGSALGSNTVLKSWAKGELEGPSKLVMNQAEAYAVFSKLCEQNEKEASVRSYNSTRRSLPMKSCKIKCSRFGGQEQRCQEQSGQPGLGLHQRPVSKGAASEKKALPQVSQILLLFCFQRKSRSPRK